MFAVDVVEGLAFFGQRVASKKHKDYHVFFKEKNPVSWIFTCSLLELEVGRNPQGTSLKCPLHSPVSFSAFPYVPKKKIWLAQLPRGENPRFSPPEMREATLRCTFCNSQFQARRRPFTSRGLLMENKKYNPKRLFVWCCCFLGVEFVFLLMLGIVFES